MHATDKSNRILSLSVGTAMAAVLLSGCAASPAPRADVSASAAQHDLARGRHDRAIEHAEAAVAAEPHNAAYRMVLANAYLDAGRFTSAETTFSDAMTLGDNSPRAALSLALTKIAQAKYTEAAALLNDWDGEIARADLGLALALAGQPDRGIHIMANAIRGGENNAKIRQNLAYAYAIAGRWREARLMAQQDLPAGEVNDRMEQWAALVSAQSYQRRVASLLQVPEGVRDTGQPVRLALANNPSIEQLASEASALGDQSFAATELAANDGVKQTAAAPAADSDKTRFAIPAHAQELPSVGEAKPALASAAPEPVARPKEFAQAFAVPAPGGNSLASVTQDTLRFVSNPVVQKIPARHGAMPAAPATPRETRAAAAAHPDVPRIAGEAAARSAEPVLAAKAPAADGSHLVQLGSFLSEQGARRAWGIYVSRYPELAEQDMVLTQAVVRGKRYWRVSAGGFDRAASRAMCSRVRSEGGEGCITWAAARPLPGAVDTGTRLARR